MLDSLAHVVRRDRPAAVKVDDGARKFEDPGEGARVPAETIDRELEQALARAFDLAGARR